VALVLERPLEQIGEVPLRRLAREGPALCAQVVRAVGSDAELERLLAPAGSGEHEGFPPAARLGELAGARDPGEHVRVIEALRAILWEQLLAELHWPSFDRLQPRLLADLADRLAHVCASALEVALSRPAPAAARAPLPRLPRADVREDRTGPAPRPTSAVLIDERAEAAPKAWLPTADVTRMPPGALPWDVPPRAEPGRAGGTPRARVDGDAPQAQSGIAQARPVQDAEVRIERRPGA